MGLTRSFDCAQDDESVMLSEVRYHEVETSYIKSKDPSTALRMTSSTLRMTKEKLKKVGKNGK